MFLFFDISGTLIYFSTEDFCPVEFSHKLADVSVETKNFYDSGEKYLLEDFLIFEKKKEAQNIILGRYPLWKQINLNRMGGPDSEIMNTWIDSIRGEENKNGAEADFTSFL